MTLFHATFFGYFRPAKHTHGTYMSVLSKTTSRLPADTWLITGVKYPSACQLDDHRSKYISMQAIGIDPCHLQIAVVSTCSVVTIVV